MARRGALGRDRPGEPLDNDDLQAVKAPPGSRALTHGGHRRLLPATQSTNRFSERPTRRAMKSGIAAADPPSLAPGSKRST